MRSTALLILAVALAACSSTSNPGPDTGSDVPGSTDATSGDDASLDAQTTPLDVPGDLPAIDAATHQYTTSIGPIHLNPGDEITLCVIRRLGNDTAQYVRRVTAELGPSSHHLIFYRSVQTTERLTPFRCTGLSGITNFQMMDAPLLIAQQAHTQLQMPDGVGIAIDANQMTRIEFHLINITDAPADVSGTVTLDTADRTAPLTPGDLMFWGNANITIPAHSTAQVNYWHRTLSGIRIFGLTSHTHHLGTLATINAATDATPTDYTNVMDSMELHRSTSWSDPPLTLFDPPLTLPSGTGLHLQCNYNNTTDTPVSFGESFNDEMCFLWAYYYPAPRGMQICADFQGISAGQCYPPGG
jgi:hypothetical protein